MKKLLGIAVIVLTVGWTNGVSAQTVGKAVDKTGEAIGKGAKTVGHKTAEVAVKGTSGVVDKVYKGKAAPDGSNVYIDKADKKYYITKKGKKVYLKKSQITDKKD